MNPVVTKIFEGRSIFVRSLIANGKNLLREGDYVLDSNRDLVHIQMSIGSIVCTDVFFRDAYKEININGVPTRCLILNSDDGEVKEGDVFIKGNPAYALKVSLRNYNVNGSGNQLYRPMPEEAYPDAKYRIIKIEGKDVKCRRFKDEEIVQIGDCYQSGSQIDIENKPRRLNKPSQNDYLFQPPGDPDESFVLYRPCEGELQAFQGFDLSLEKPVEPKQVGITAYLWEKKEHQPFDAVLFYDKAIAIKNGALEAELLEVTLIKK